MRYDSIGDLYPIISTNNYQASYPSTFATITIILWHNKLGHPRPSVSHSLRKNKFICYENLSSSIVCESCVFRKHVKLSFYASSSNTFMPFEIIHSDLWTSPIWSSAWHKYYILFLDDYSNFLWTLPIRKNPKHTWFFFSSLSVLIKTQFEKNIKCFQCDNGKKFDNEPFKKFCDKNGLIFQFPCLHTSPENGKVERKIRTINNIVCTLLAHTSMPLSFWHHVLEMTIYLLNIIPKNLSNTNPQLKFYITGILLIRIYWFSVVYATLSSLPLP